MLVRLQAALLLLSQALTFPRYTGRKQLGAVFSWAIAQAFEPLEASGIGPSRAQENERQKKDGLPSSVRIAMRSRLGQTKPCELLVTQSHYGIDMRGPARRDVARREGNNVKQQRDSYIGNRVRRGHLEKQTT